MPHPRSIYGPANPRNPVDTRSVVAEPQRDGWHGRPVWRNGSPPHLGAVLYDAVTGQFDQDVAAARRYFLHDHREWEHLGGDFTQPTGYVDAAPDPATPEGARYLRRNQCACHGDVHEPGWWITHRDWVRWAEYAYVLGDEAMTIEVQANSDGCWWKVAETDWTQPPPDWDRLSHHRYR